MRTNKNQAKQSKNTVGQNMLVLNTAKRVCVIGGGTAGWFAALSLRKVFHAQTEVMLIESPDVGIVGVGEGGILNLMDALSSLKIDIPQFIQATGAAFKLGFAYEGWRNAQTDDRFYHLFYRPQNSALAWFQYGFFPAISAAIAQGQSVSDLLNGAAQVKAGLSQHDAAAMLQQPDCGINASLHFDSQRVAAYLCQVATARGVVHVRQHVQALLGSTSQQVTHIQTDTDRIETDFVIDATGFRRLSMQHLRTKWRSFADCLILDRAIPFHMPHPQPHPSLVTRAIAMNSGWMWQIPLQHRVGAGYVFSSKHITEDAALAEIEQRVGHTVQPMRTLKFEAGHYEQVWQGNIMAIGLASGFVEPLEATSIGQMLEQLRNFRRLVQESHGVVALRAIDEFNQNNNQYWQGIRDFLRMHYDCPRRDTPFWQDVARLPLPDSYASIKDCWQQRSPRQIDTQSYATGGWQPMFSLVSWSMIASSLGLINPQAAAQEVAKLPPDAQQRLNDLMHSLNPRANSPAI